MTGRACSRCKRDLGRRAFAAHRRTPDGLQPFCRDCDADAKRQPHRGWGHFRPVIAADGVQHLWTREVYLELFNARNWECHWCGAMVCEWGSGHWVDRINSAEKHVPGNCIPCCWPCNKTKGVLNPAIWRRIAELLVAEAGGRGKVPWASHRPDVVRRPMMIQRDPDGRVTFVGASATDATSGLELRTTQVGFPFLAGGRR